MSYSKLKAAYDASPLPSLGVKLPRAGTQKGETLCYLFERLGKVVKKADAEKEICGRLGIQPKDLQSLRHLGKQDGYNICQGRQVYHSRTLALGEYVLVCLTEPNGYWKAKRRDETTLDFKQLKKKYNFSCASCGAREGKEHRHTKKVVTLEKGHKNPELPMKDGNIIPQCTYCNQVAKGKWIFDSMGFPKYMTVEGLLSHPREKQKEFLETLQKEFNG